MTMASVTRADGLLAWLRSEEGFSATPYRCTEGFLTVGYGLNLDAGVTREEAEWLLQHRVQRTQDEVIAALPWARELDEVRLSILVALAYQLKGGIAGLLKFKATLAMVRAGNYASAAQQMMQSLWAKQTPARAKRTTEAMRTGRWPPK